MTNDPVYHEAIARLGELFEAAGQLSIKEPLAMALATADADGRPSVRMVLMRGFDERGIVFYTSVNGRKGRELADNPRAAVCFYWEGLEQQLRVEGTVAGVSDEEADAYWANRPRESRIGAWASFQSHTLESRDILQQRVAEYEAKFPGEDIPRPDFWRGYRIIPDRIEFWRGQPARLHEREVYEHTADGWKQHLLYP